jgi:hypothetical protein
VALNGAVYPAVLCPKTNKKSVAKSEGIAGLK